MSTLINCQIVGSCNYNDLVPWTPPPPSHCVFIWCGRLCLQVEPFLPYEYTCEGMLERVHAYIQKQVGVETRIQYIYIQISSKNDIIIASFVRLQNDLLIKFKLADCVSTLIGHHTY